MKKFFEYLVVAISFILIIPPEDPAIIAARIEYGSFPEEIHKNLK